MIEQNCCPICASTHSKTIRTATFSPEAINSDDFRITDNRYGQCWTFKRCLACRMVYSSPTPEAADLEMFYRQLDDREYGQEAAGRAKNFQTILRQLGKLPLAERKLLDIGSANGLFISLARQNGFAADGIEPSTALVREAHERYGIEVFHGTLQTFKPTHGYDVVTLLDLIEHLAEPLPFLRSVHALMNEDAMLVIVTPDIDSLAACFLRRRWWHHRIAHIHFFPLETLVFMLKKCGFELVKKRRYAWHFSAIYLVSRLIPLRFIPSALQGLLKKLNLKVQLFDSWEIYAKKSPPLS